MYSTSSAICPKTSKFYSSVYYYRTVTLFNSYYCLLLFVFVNLFGLFFRGLCSFYLVMAELPETNEMMMMMMMTNETFENMLITRNTFCGTWCLPHSQVHSERTVPIIMAGCMAHARNGCISTFGLKSGVTVVFLDRDFRYDADISAI